MHCTCPLSGLKQTCPDNIEHPLMTQAIDHAFRKWRWRITLSFKLIRHFVHSGLDASLVFFTAGRVYGPSGDRSAGYQIRK